MAYSGKISCDNYYKAITEIVRFLCDDPTTPGRDWTVDYYEVNTTDSNNIQGESFSGTIDVTANEWAYLPTGFVFDESFTDSSGSSITPIELDRILGKVKFDVTDTITYSYTFRRCYFRLFNTGLGGDERVFVPLKVQIYTTQSDMHIRVGTYYRFENGAEACDNMLNYALAIWYNPSHVWIFSNKQRFIVVAESEAYYSILYAGLVYAFMLRDDLPYPYVCVASHRCNSDYSSVWWHADESNARFPLYRGTCIISDSFNVQSDEEEEGDYWENKISPEPASDLDAIDYPSGEDIFMIPIMIWNTSPIGFAYGIYDGICYFPYTNVTSESIITDANGKNWIVFPDVYRNDQRYWHAICCD